MRHYLIVYDRADREIVYLERFADGRDAIAKRFEIEKTDDASHEVVVLGAESLAQLRCTHSRYFLTVAEMLRTPTRPSWPAGTGA